MVQDDPLRVRAEVGLRDLGHVCALQGATISTEAFPNATIRAQVASISPLVSARSIATVGSEERGNDVVRVILNLQRGTPALPIGLPVTIRFDPCPSKT
jgi:hypothetical protein